MRITVIGGGKMGLPLACQFAGRGGIVTVCDTNAELVDNINQGICPFDEPELDEKLKEVVAAGNLSATVETGKAVSQSQVVVVIVPVLLSSERDADLRIIESVTIQIAESMKKGTVVSYETTLPVGTTRGRLLPILEAGGLVCGQDFELVFSPERVKSQMVFQRLTENAKVVGGITPAGEERAAEFYQQYLGAPVRRVGSPEAAEFVKLAGMVYRDVNIALANELARYADEVGVNMKELIDDINTDGEAALLQPGIGVGGHCTPVYPHFLLQDAQRRQIHLPVIENGRSINDAQPGYIVSRIEKLWGSLSGQTVVILGLGFRPGVKEALYSPAYELADQLKTRNANVLLHDPLYFEEEIEAHGFKPGKPDEATVVILNTAHEHYRNFHFAGLARGKLRLVVDGRNFWSPEQVKSCGLTYLAIGTGQPTPAVGKIPLSKLSLTEADCTAVSDVIRSGWIMQGPVVEAFERDFAQYVGAPYACAVSSGTTALQAALLALDIGAGDEVITVSHSFIATANVIRHVGAKPIFADIEPDTFNICPEAVEALIGPNTKAVLAVHQMGLPCDLDRLLAICRKHSLPLIEDAACALGSEILLNRDNAAVSQWQRIGAPHGTVACFSFHPRKIISTGDGGIITTADETLAAKFKLLRNHGMSADAVKRSSSSAFVQETFPVVGFNFRMTDMQAALARQQLKRLEHMLAARKEAAALYRRLLAQHDGIIVPQDKQWTRSNWQSFCIRLQGKERQAAVLKELSQRGIAGRRGITCAHREPAYAGGDWGGGSLKHSEEAQDNCVILPIFDSISRTQVEQVVQALAQCLKPARGRSSG